MESKVQVTEERISQSIHQCFPANISEPDSSVSDEPLLRYSHSIRSIFRPPISESDSSPVSGERLQKFCPSIDSIFPPANTQTNSPANGEIITYNSIESCFPPRCDSDSDSSVPYDINIINRYLRSFSIQSYFPSFRSSSVTSVDGNPSLSVNSNSSFNFESYPNGQILEKPSLKEFTFANLKTATRNFKSDSLLGEGSFGRVFKGWMNEKTLTPSKVGTGMIVAIKKLDTEINMQGFQEWQSAVKFLERLSHPNLIKLLGYCQEGKERLLVYEFMKKGSLDNHLYRNPNIEQLSWNIRLKIAIGAARGLAFLHASENQVIYGDFKSSNILLDKSYNAKISDFGLEKYGPSGGDSHVTTRVKGTDTYVYAAPEYIATGHLYMKSDVYGFGVVLLELLTGLLAIDARRPTRQENLVTWLKPSLSDKGKLKTMMNARLGDQYSFETAFQVAQLTLKCLESIPENRPSMKDVVEALERIEPIK